MCVYVITSQISFPLTPFLLKDSALVGMPQGQRVNQEIRDAFFEKQQDLDLLFLWDKHTL